MTGVGMNSIQSADRSINILERLDALDRQAKIACSPGSTYDDNLPRWHPHNVLFWQLHVYRLGTWNGIEDWLSKRGLGWDWIGLCPRNTQCEVLVPRVWWSAPYDQESPPTAKVTDIDIIQRIAGIYRLEDVDVERYTLAAMKRCSQKDSETDKVTGTDELQRCLAQLDSGHPRFTHLQCDALICPMRSYNEVTLDHLRYGDSAKGIPPFLGDDARPFKLSTNQAGSDALGGCFPEVLSLEDMIDLGGGRSRRVKHFMEGQALHMSLGDCLDDWQKESDKRQYKQSLLDWTLEDSSLGRLITRPSIASRLAISPDPGTLCIVSAAGSFTDWHADSSGASAWVRLLKGMKIWYWVRPTKENLVRLAKATQDKTLADPSLFGWVGVFVQRPGNTFFLPSGGIHAVYTVEDSIMVSGDFLTRHDYETQSLVWRYEDSQSLAITSRYPDYLKICMQEIIQWSAVIKAAIKQPSPTTAWHKSLEMPTTQSLRHLARFILHEASNALVGPRKKKKRRRDSYPFADVGDFGPYTDKTTIRDIANGLVSLLDDYEMTCNDRDT